MMILSATSATADRAQLAVRADSRLTAAGALTWFTAHPADRAVGFALSATSARWFRVEHDAVTGAGGDWSWNGVFELRAFDGERELRWLNVSGGLGHAVVLAETPAAPRMPAGVDVSLEEVSARRRRELREFAGTVTESIGGWSTLFEARYEPVRVPITAEPGERVAIESSEYVSWDQHGNIAVVDARLVGLVALAAPPKPEGHRAATATHGGN